MECYIPLRNVITQFYTPTSVFSCGKCTPLYFYPILLIVHFSTYKLSRDIYSIEGGGAVTLACGHSGCETPRRACINRTTWHV